jgi:DNA-binding XRE family transcriptional regulator
MENELTKFEKWVAIYGQSRLARELDVSRQAVNNWISQRQRPSDNFKIKIVGISNHVIEYKDFFK